MFVLFLKEILFTSAGIFFWKRKYTLYISINQLHYIIYNTTEVYINYTMHKLLQIYSSEVINLHMPIIWIAVIIKK